jgi:hypothetical protein
MLLYLLVGKVISTEWVCAGSVLGDRNMLYEKK